MEKEFTNLINKYRALIFKVCNLYCDDVESRKDLFQEIVLQAWKSYPNFRKDSGASTWLYRIALNTAISNFRKESKKPDRLPFTTATFEIPDLVSNDEKENRTAMQEAISKLTDVEKAIILLYLDEKSYEEMSDIIGITISNVGVRLTRIKNKLSNLVKSTL
ncbi:MAG: sigma-70 family RNA polymerase sigma factor [Ginsengibacter sp.]